VNASESHHLSREFRSQISIIKLSPGIFPRRPSSRYSAVFVNWSPQRIVGGYIFRCLNILPLRCHQCPPVLNCQTETPQALLPTSQETRPKELDGQGIRLTSTLNVLALRFSQTRRNSNTVQSRPRLCWRQWI
jgi:hypothetical protein